MSADELDEGVVAELSTLPAGSRDRVTKHLVMAGRLLDIDPEAAYQHALVASQGTQRLAVIREAAGITAYASGRYDEACKQLRAARRISGSDAYLAMIADCERALGRPEKALEVARGVKGGTHLKMTTADVVELRIVAAGALRDLGRVSEALELLKTKDLGSRQGGSWLPRLRYAYADALVASGEVELGREWFARTVDVDTYGETDAEERLAALVGEPSPSGMDREDDGPHSPGSQPSGG